MIVSDKLPFFSRQGVMPVLNWFPHNWNRNTKYSMSVSCNKTRVGGEDWHVVSLEKLGFRGGRGSWVHKSFLKSVWVVWENLMLLARCLAGKELMQHKKWACKKNNRRRSHGQIKSREKSIFHVRDTIAQTCIELFDKHWDDRVTVTKGNKSLPYGLYYCRFSINLFF